MPRLTERDLLCVKWIAQQGVVRLDTISLLLHQNGYVVDARSLRHLSSRWETMGLVGKERILANAPSILWATRAAVKLAELPTSKKEKFGRPSFATLHHDLAVSRVRIEYEKHEAKWTCERVLRNFVQDDYLPDGLAELNGTSIFVEIDRTPKDPQRLLNIMRAHAQNPNVMVVDYWTTSELHGFVNKYCGQVNSEIGRQGLRTFLLPKEVNL
jgi:hypothetical protein